MTENVQPLFPEHEEIHKQVIEFVAWLHEEVCANRVACMTVRGVSRDGEPFGFDIVPINGETLRYMMIGQLEEAKAMLTSEP